MKAPKKSTQDRTTFALSTKESRKSGKLGGKKKGKNKTQKKKGK